MDYPPKYPRTLHWPTSPCVHSDDKCMNDVTHFLGNEIIITEKIDGANTALWRGDVYARSTGLPTRNGWMSMTRKHHAWKTRSLMDNVVLYGEDIFGVHSIEYDPVDESETLRIFAGRHTTKDVVDDWFMSWDDLVETCTQLDLPVVPVIHRGVCHSASDIESILQREMLTESALGNTKEGFVIRTVDPFRPADFGKFVAKYVRPNHVQTDEHWTKNWKSCTLKISD